MAVMIMDDTIALPPTEHPRTKRRTTIKIPPKILRQPANPTPLRYLSTSLSLSQTYPPLLHHLSSSPSTSPPLTPTNLPRALTMTTLAVTNAISSSIPLGVAVLTGVLD